MDMPKNCSECPCCYVPRCEVLEKSLNTNEIYECKPDWCPLKEVPQKKNRTSVVGDYLKGSVDGYNACIDEILKGSDIDGKID